jgi:hypothetical protein
MYPFSKLCRDPFRISLLFVSHHPSCQANGRLLVFEFLKCNTFSCVVIILVGDDAVE